MTTVDGKKYNWCKHYKTEGLFEVTYITQPHNHDDWKQKRNEWNGNRTNQRNLKAKMKLANYLLLPSQTS